MRRNGKTINTQNKKPRSNKQPRKPKDGKSSYTFGAGKRKLTGTYHSPQEVADIVKKKINRKPPGGQ